MPYSICNPVSRIQDYGRAWLYTINIFSPCGNCNVNFTRVGKNKACVLGTVSRLSQSRSMPLRMSVAPEAIPSFRASGDCFGGKNAFSHVCLRLSAGNDIAVLSSYFVKAVGIVLDCPEDSELGQEKASEPAGSEA